MARRVKKKRQTVKVSHEILEQIGQLSRVCQVNCVWIISLGYFRKSISVSHIEMI